MKLKKTITVVNLLEIGSMLFAFGVIVMVLVQRFQLPAGACPIDQNRPLLYFALILLIGVNLGTSVYRYWKKKKTRP